MNVTDMRERTLAAKTQLKAELLDRMKLSGELSRIEAEITKRADAGQFYYCYDGSREEVRLVAEIYAALGFTVASNTLGSVRIGWE